MLKSGPISGFIILALATGALYGDTPAITIQDPDAGSSSPGISVPDPDATNKKPGITVQDPEKKGAITIQDPDGESSNKPAQPANTNDKPAWKFTLRGSAELEATLNVEPGIQAEDILKKNELRNHLEMKFGTSTLFFYLENNIYAGLLTDTHVNAYQESDFTLQRNLTMSNNFSEVNFREFYFNFEYKFFRLRVGNMIHAWGTTDVFNPTSYFNPYDLREFLLKDDNEMKLGIPSLSTLFVFGAHAIELVVVPLHVPALMAPGGNFWGISYREGPFPVVISPYEGLPFAIENIAAGVRYYTNVAGFDLKASIYYGPDRDPVLRPTRTLLVPGQPVSLEVLPEHHPAVFIGFAGAKSVHQFVFQLEVAYSPNRKGVVDQDLSGGMPSLPFRIRETHNISYAVGANWFIPLNDWIKGHQGTALLSVEWYQNINIDQELMKPLLTDLITIRLEDTFLEDRLKASITSIVEVTTGSFILMPKISYRFKEGISLAATYALIMGEEGSTMGYYDRNDIVSVRVRYDY